MYNQKNQQVMENILKLMKELKLSHNKEIWNIYVDRFGFEGLFRVQRALSILHQEGFLKRKRNTNHPRRVYYSLSKRKPISFIGKVSPGERYVL